MIGTVSKTVMVLVAIVGSNPTLSASNVLIPSLMPEDSCFLKGAVWKY